MKKQHFGLQIPNIKTCFKKAQTGREHKMKHSKDNNIRKLHCVKAKSEEEKVRWSACLPSFVEGRFLTVADVLRVGLRRSRSRSFAVLRIER